MSLSNIVKGWTSLLLTEMGFKEIPAHAVERANECNKCPLNNNNICDSCGCYLPAKTLVSGETCPLNKWQQ
jgi:hypothetical protein